MAMPRFACTKVASRLDTLCALTPAGNANVNKTRRVKMNAVVRKIMVPRSSPGSGEILREVYHGAPRPRHGSGGMVVLLLSPHDSRGPFSRLHRAFCSGAQHVRPGSGSGRIVDRE